ncbi:uncharacterized protein [Triticum aestivum]|uniref:uncharacterized protein n=1 Tax=Triticum aestivum TaxID=4565 RepID=UPI001D008B73|nr:uncharacterized protein LOC123041482 [Triticum aestivum]
MCLCMYFLFFYPSFLRMAFFWHISGTMDDSSKEMQEDRLPVNPDANPSNVTADNETEARSTAPTIGYKRQRMSKAIIARGPRPSDIDSNEDVSRDADKDPEFDKDNEREADKDIEDHPRKAKRQKSSGNEGFRNRGSPARLYKLNKSLISVQKG